MSLFNPCIKASGPKNARIAIVGEAPGGQEEMQGVPWVGEAGQLLTECLKEAGLERREIYLTNVLFTRPPGNKVEALCLDKKALPKGYPYSAIKSGKYLHPDLFVEIERLKVELEELKPNLVVAMGNTAIWALLGHGSIGKVRGTVVESKLIPGLKVLPTYHPAALLHGQWQWRVLIITDLEKAKIEADFPDFRRPHRRLTIDPELHEVLAFVEEAEKAPVLSVDVETERRQITTVGFATAPDRGFVVPIWDKRKPGWSYWTEARENIVWNALNILLRNHPRLLFQNGLYDMVYLWRMGIRVGCCPEDTMLQHHSLYSEMPKGLGFLGSIYTNEPAWKSMRRDSEVEKRDA